MKTAILISAYKNFDILLLLLRYLNKQFKCYVHIDKKVKIPKSFWIAINELDNVYIIQKYEINWGSYKHVMAFLTLLKCAYKDGCEYFHLIPADTFPVKKNDIFEEFYKNNSNLNYIEMIPVDSDLELQKRQKYFYMQHVYNVKTDFGYRVEQILLKTQRLLGVNRKIRLHYKGYLYCHLSRAFVEFVLSFLDKNRWYIPLIKSYSIPEEFFFQNIISKSDYVYINDHLIYNKWKQGAGGPSVLARDQVDDAIMAEGYLFARKIYDINVARYLLDKIS